METKKKKEVVVEEAPLVEVAAPAPVDPPVVSVPVRAPRKISFEQWASRHNKPKHHWDGMRAFVKNSSRPRFAAEWDRLFATY